MTASTATAGSLSLSAETLHLAFSDPFRIARALDAQDTTNVIVEVRDSDLAPAPDGAHRVGLGEGCPDAYFGETEATVHAVLPLLLEAATEGWEAARAAATMSARVACSPPFRRTRIKVPWLGTSWSRRPSRRSSTSWSKASGVVVRT